MIKKTIIGILMFVNITGCGVKNWKPVDQALMAGFTAGNVVDIFQTREIKRDNSGYSEQNRILDGLSRDQATAVMVGVNYGLYLLADKFPEIRTPLLGGANAIKWGFVIHNRGIGVRGRW